MVKPMASAMRALNNLSDRAIKAFVRDALVSDRGREPGKLFDGSGLYPRLTPAATQPFG